MTVGEDEIDLESGFLMMPQALRSQFPLPLRQAQALSFPPVVNRR